jgi:LysM repeat protein
MIRLMKPSLHAQSRRSCRVALWTLLACLLLFFLLGFDAPPSLAKSTKTPKTGSGGSGTDVIAAVNQLRQSRGLSPYQVNSALMASAQGHSNYQASIGSITHTGSGGSDPKSRAIAAGYGGGATVFVSENIYGGSTATVQNAVTYWQGDSLHLNTMLSPNYVDAGAGVATSGGMTYFTLDAGYIAGSPGSGNGTPLPTLNPLTPAATAVPFYPVQVATPLPDGSIVHYVQPGQTLWSIAASYKVGLAELLRINGFGANPIIRPGQKIIIRLPGTAPATEVTETLTTPELIAIELPTGTSTPAAISLTTTTPRLKSFALITPSKALKTASSSRVDPLLILIAALVVGGTALIIIGNVLKRG